VSHSYAVHSLFDRPAPCHVSQYLSASPVRALASTNISQSPSWSAASSHEPTFTSG
jgi:hypothetical protein